MPVRGYAAPSHGVKAGARLDWLIPVTPYLFLTSLALQGKVAAATQNQALSALLFLDRDMLELELPWPDDFVAPSDPCTCPSR